MVKRIVIAALVALITPAGVLATSSARLCESAKLKAATSYYQCRGKADAVYAKSARTQVDLQKRDGAVVRCDDALSKAYASAEERFGADCPTNADVESIRGHLMQCADEVVASLWPEPTPTPEVTPTPVVTATPPAACASDAQCGPGYRCQAGLCKLVEGGACVADAQCLSAACCFGACRDLTKDLDHCGTCGTACAPANAVGACSAGACGISSCAAAASNCDGSVVTGCEVKHDAVANACAAAFDLGSACADEQYGCGYLSLSCCSGVFTAFASQSGRTSKWFRAQAQDCSSSQCGSALTHRVSLQSPPGVDYDLYVYSDCSTLIGSSTMGTGALDQIVVSRADQGGSSDSFTYWVEVRHVAGSSCSNWQLTDEGFP